MSKLQIFPKLVGLGLLVVLTSWFIHIPEIRQITKYVFYLRYPLVAGLFLFLFPTVLRKVLSPVLENLFVLSSNLQIAIVAGSSVLAGMATTLVTKTILINAHLRFNVDNLITTLNNNNQLLNIIESREYLIENITAIILGLPITCLAIHLSLKEEKSRKEKPNTKTKVSLFGSIFFSLIVTFILLGIITAVRYLLKNTCFLDTILLNTFSFLHIDIAGYVIQGQKGCAVNDTLGILAPGIEELMAFFVLQFAIYFVLYPILDPKKKLENKGKKSIFNILVVPALAYIPVILSCMVILFGGLSYFLDFFNIPSFVIFIIVSAFSYWLAKTDHYYELKKLNKQSKQSGEDDDNSTNKPDLDDWIQAINTRLEKSPLKNKILVVVCASGGGIQAAGWTTQVLTGLQEILGTAFTQSIGWISSVSGGSVGTMFYLDRFGENGYPKDDELKLIFDNATDNSLDAIGWGLAFPDLLRFTGFSWVVNKMQDRGSALENDWKCALKDDKASLNTWREKAERGIIPIPIMNATLVEDGRRFLISPMTFSSKEKQETFYIPNLQETQSKSIDFNTLYDGYNIDVTTAARLSATFPYVSPVARPEPKPNLLEIFHVADGGYFDNFGVATSVELLEKFLSSDHSQEIRKVIFLEINAFPNSQISNENQGKPGWLMAVIGSIEALLNVRSSTQTDANSLHVKLIKERWRNGAKSNIDIENFNITFPVEKQQEEQPLSWKLTPTQKKNIQDGWNMLVEGRVKNDDVISRLKDKWEEWCQLK
ncbi:MAG TPA: hypothetical protein VK184_17560 [Nostocaceae cyanobacterium]|nr:hypothetical protein [Nostocaceae cyanobacterium]